MENQTDTPEAAGDILQRIIGNFPKPSPSEEEEREYERKRLARIAEDDWRDKAERARALWECSNVPPRHADFQIPKDGPWRNAYDSLESKIGSGFLYVLMGNRGTGKTQMAVAMIRAYTHQHFRAGVYVKALDVFIALREAYRKDGDAESRVINRFVSPEFLVIDAMEERGETPFEDRLLNHIIDKRYDDCADTLLITNQSLEYFATSVGASIISRIHETGDKIICNWESFRKKTA